jgi:hypothetical protein
VNLAEEERVNELFIAAADLPANEWAGFLAMECGADTNLRAQVDLLLVEHDRTGGLLDVPSFPAGSFSDGFRDDDLWAGRVLEERYRIERLVGRGGMSTVYLLRICNWRGGA